MADFSDSARLERMEKKMDEFGQSLVLLARIDERILHHMQEQQRLSVRQEKIERRCDDLNDRIDSLDLIRAKFVGAVAVVGSVVAIAADRIKAIFFG